MSVLDIVVSACDSVVSVLVGKQPRKDLPDLFLGSWASKCIFISKSRKDAKMTYYCLN